MSKSWMKDNLHPFGLLLQQKKKKMVLRGEDDGSIEGGDITVSLISSKTPKLNI